MVVSRLSGAEQDQLAHLLREILRSVDPDGDPE
jgi:hypothetical protein